LFVSHEAMTPDVLVPNTVVPVRRDEQPNILDAPQANGGLSHGSV
jgi:hypothetical protein